MIPPLLIITCWSNTQLANTPSSTLHSKQQFKTTIPSNTTWGFYLRFRENRIYPTATNETTTDDKNTSEI